MIKSIIEFIEQLSPYERLILKAMIGMSIVYGSYILADKANIYNEMTIPETKPYKTSNKGVRYFTDCIEGKLYIVTPTYYESKDGNFYNISGPIGDCK